MVRPSPVLPHALKLPILDALQHRRVILASSSPRRRDILKVAGLQPEIIPSTFEENLDKAEFAGRAGEYPLLTAQEKVSGADSNRSCYSTGVCAQLIL